MPKHMSAKGGPGYSGKKGFIGITMGCPAGVGPEILLRFAAGNKGFNRFSPIAVGDIELLRRAAKELQISLAIEPWQPGEPFEPGRLPVVEPDSAAGYSLDAGRLLWGVPGKETGLAAGAYIHKAVGLIDQGVVDAMVTCPIAKHAMQAAGYAYPGHTEMLAFLCNTDNYGMMMAGKNLRVSLVTIHAPLAKVPELLTRQEITRIIRLTGETLIRDFGIPEPKIGVAGLNPHSGEHGLFGLEEDRVIGPAIKEAASGRWRVAGPLPPDTVFRQAMDKSYDAVVAMYHDQGLIPFKLVHFEDGVNLTMGLPIIRTSVDHGTAYDIAGRGLASHSSLAAAYEMAAGIVANRKAVSGNGAGQREKNSHRD